MRTRSRGTARRYAVLLAAGLLAAGCQSGTRPVFHDAAATPAAAPTLSDPPVPSSPQSVATPRPAGSRTPSRAPTRPRYTPAPLTLTLTEPFPPIQGSQITALYQDGCGDPTRGLVYVEVGDPASISTVWYEYHVATPVSFDGANHGPSVLGDDFRVWRGMIGPFDADPRNAGGGPITVTAHGVYKDGTARSVTATWTLESCHH
ncbi:MAG TPA: hypothetical protein VEO01_13385 [Pseudonocardiaceae bacterium]|nr:hypothetical protein [Pseudonocardiaceae bacterium]